MMYIPKIDYYYYDCYYYYYYYYYYLEISADKDVKKFVAINFSESISEMLNLRKVGKSLHIFLTTADEVQSNSSDDCIRHYNVVILNLFHPKLQLINTKPVLKTKSKRLLNELKKFNVQTVLVLDYKERKDHQIFHSSTKLIAIDSLMKHLNPCIKRSWQK